MEEKRKKEETEVKHLGKLPNFHRFPTGGETRPQQSRLASKVGSSFAIGLVVVVPKCQAGRPVFGVDVPDMFSKLFE